MSVPKVLSFDIETVAKVQHYTYLDDAWQQAWIERCDIYNSADSKLFENDDSVNYDFYQGCWVKYAALNPDYSRILCISVSTSDSKQYSSTTFKSDSIPTDEEEKTIIETFFKVLIKMFDVNGYRKFGGHNVKNFDIPFVQKRAMSLGIPYSNFPSSMQTREMKPWEMNHIFDTKELYSFGSYMMKSSLNETCLSLNVPTPKEGEVKGSEIYSHVYEKHGNLKEIYDYCERDTEATLAVYGKLI